MKKKNSMELRISDAKLTTFPDPPNHLYANNILKESTNTKDESTDIHDGIVYIKPIETDPNKLVNHNHKDVSLCDSNNNNNNNNHILRERRIESPKRQSPKCSPVTCSSVQSNSSPVRTSPICSPGRPSSNCSPVRLSSSRSSPKTSPRLSLPREVIKIDDENIRTGISKPSLLGMKKPKRKKGCLDALLSQVEAKKRKEELMSRAESRVPITDPHIEERTSNHVSYVGKDSLKMKTVLDHNRAPIHRSEHCRDHEFISHTKGKMKLLKENWEDHSTSSYRNENVYNMKLKEGRLSAFDTRTPNTESRPSDHHSKHHHSDPHHDDHRTLLPYHYDTSKQEKFETDNKNDIKNENVSRKKKKLSGNEKYSNLTSSQLQRRLVANARERSRVHALSNAFDTLRSAIPSYSPEQKLSKLTILRVAINYINALQQILTTDTLNIYENRVFVSHVNECSCVLQTEYGRSKMKLSME